MATTSQLLRGALHQLDERGVAMLYRSISVSVSRTRSRLRAAGLPFVEPGVVAPRPVELDATAQWVIAQSRASSAAVGGMAGLWGILSIPPEIGAYLVATVRMAQRLAIVYGFDPESDRGRMALAQALAVGFDIELPERGRMSLSLTDLFQVLSKGPGSTSFGAVLTRSLLSRTARMIGGRATRFVPLLSSGFVAADNQRRTGEIGAKMLGVFTRLAELPLSPLALVEDAIEVR